MANSESVDKILLKAQLLLQDNKADAAIKLYQQVLNTEPDHTEALRYLALAYVQTEQIDLAIAIFKQALDLIDDPIIHMNLANVYKKNQNYSLATQHYKKAIKLNPQYAKAHNNLAGLYRSLKNFPEALLHYKEAVHADPSFTLAHLNLGILLFTQQEIEPAITQFNNVLAIDEHNVNALFYLGLIYFARDNISKASDFFTEVLAINSEHVESLVNLGVIALRQNKAQLAIDYFTKALAFDEHNLEARNNLAATFVHNDRFENALQYYLALLAEDPHNIEYLYNTGVAQMGLGHIEDATSLFTRVLELDQKHFGALSNLAAIKMRRKDKPAAISLLQRAVDVEPNNKTTRFMLQALQEVDGDIPACEEYARDLFNHYALYYEKHMQDTLQYKLPEKLWEILHSLNQQSFAKVLDLGCGTGLCGDVLKRFTENVTGVDIAEKMLSVAKSKDIYQNLICQDISEYLMHNSEQFDLIVAADVLPYFGSLDVIFANVCKSLANNGIFIFTTEISMDKNWQVQESIRFSHSQQYVTELCAKHHLYIKYKEQTIARMQDEKALEEMIYLVKFAKF